jgi:phospholipase/carboxylesterase
MNRIPMFPTAADSESSGASATVGHVSSALFVPVRGEQASALFAPVHYESNYAYPLLVWLHGNGDDENQLKRIMPLISLRNYIGLAVRGTNTISSPSGRTGYTWSQARAHVALAEQAVFDAIELAGDRYHVSPDRVFLAGYDTGGTMALRLAFSHARRFAGVLSLGGEMPTDRAPLGRIADARRLAVFLGYGRESQKYPTATVCENLRLLHSAGMQVALRQYPCGHELAPMMLGDMDRWIMEQITGQTSDATC